MRSGTLLVLGGTIVAAAVSEARSRMIMHPRRSPAVFKMLDTPVVSPRAMTPGQIPSSLRGSKLAALADGALVIDSDSGKLLRLDAEHKVVDTMSINPEAAQLVVDRQRNLAYVSDRTGDRIVVVRPDQRLVRVRAFKTRTEPYGLALSPDGKTLLVSFVADRKVSGFDTATGKELWSVAVGPEPRGVAFSPDGRRAMVTFLSQSGVTRLSMRGNKPPVVRFNAIAASNTNPSVFNNGSQNKSPKAGRKFIRSAFAATYLSNDLAVVGHHVATPFQDTRFENRGTYGGGGRFNMPIDHRATFVRETPELPSMVRTAQALLPVHQPRALAYDGKRDILYIAGFGSDTVIALRDASRPTIRQGWVAAIPGGQTGCGPNALDVADDGRVLAFCELNRSVASLALPDASSPWAPRVTVSAELAKSRFTTAQLRGRRLFRQGNNHSLSGSGAMACANCHPEGRTDGLSWRIQGHSLQTPLLTARLVGTHPFKWDGGDKDLQTSLTMTVRRLGGFGINKTQAEDLAAYLQTLPRPRTPVVTDHAAVGRGKRLFFSKRIGCANCHNGPAYTNGKSYDLAADLKKVDTPSLIGLAHSAPYYHDGSAATLRALLLGNGTIHGMGRLRNLSEHDINDLIAFLNTL